MLWVLLLALDAGPPGDAAGRDGAVVRDAGYSEAADYGLQVAVEAEGAQPGDRVWLVLTLRYDKSLAIAVPEAMPEGRGLAPLGAPERAPEEVEGSLSETLRFPFVLLANANVETPSFELRVGEDVLNIPALPVVVNDAGPSAEPPDPDLPGMVVYRPGPAPWILPVVALSIGIILLMILLRAYMGAHPLPPTSRRSWWTQPRNFAPCSMVCADVSMMTRMFCVGVGLTCSLACASTSIAALACRPSGRRPRSCSLRWPPRGSSGSLGWG